eukprot:g12815.t1
MSAQSWHLSNLTHAQVAYRAMEMPNVPEHYRAAELLGLPLGSNASHYCLSTDYSDVRKLHSFGGNLFHADYAEPAEDAGPADPMFEAETIHFPMPIVSAEGNVLDDSACANYTATKTSIIGTLMSLSLMFGYECVKGALRGRDVKWDDIDTELWDPEYDPTDGLIRMQCHLLTDQASSEQRAWQSLHQELPGVAFLPLGHRLSNNCKDIVPELSRAAAAFRRYLRGPMSSCRNQGILMTTLKNLIKEAHESSKKASERPYAEQLKVEAGKTSIAAALEAGLGRLQHGTAARWFRTTQLAELLLNHRYAYLCVLSAIAATEGKDGAQDNAVPSGDGIDSGEDFELFDLDEDDEDRQHFQGSKPMQGCYATHLLQALKPCSNAICQAQLDLTKSQYKLFLLLEHVNSIAPDDDKLLEDPEYLEIYRQFIDPDAEAGIALTTAAFQKKLAARRWDLYKNFMAETIAEGTKNKNAAPYFMKMLSPICNSFFFDTHDPQFGLWESICKGAKEYDVEKLKALADNPPFPHNVFGKRAFKCCVDGNLEWVGEQVNSANDSRPLYEKESEAQWKERATYKTKMSAAQSNWSKLVMRMMSSQKHPRYSSLPACQHPERLNTITVERFLQAMKPVFEGEPESDEALQHCLKEFEKADVEEAGGAARFQTKRLMDLKELLESAKKAYYGRDPERRKLYPARQRSVVDAAGDLSFISVPGWDLGFRGVEAEATMEHKLDWLRRFFKQQASGWVIDRLEFLERVKEKGFLPLVHTGRKECAAAFKFRKGYWWGIRLLPVGGWDEYVWRFPTVPDDVAFLSGLVCDWDVYTHWVEGGCMGPGEFHVIMEDLDQDLCTGQEVQSEYFQWMQPGMQVDLLQPFLDQYPMITRTHLEAANSADRKTIFRMFNDGNRLTDEQVAKLANRLTLKAKPIISSHLEAKKAKIAKQDATTGELLATAKSHRQQQGQKPDRVRITYEKDTRVVAKSKLRPGVTAEGNVYENVFTTLAPCVAFATGRENDDVVVEQEDHMVDELDMWCEEEDDVEEAESSGSSDESPKTDGKGNKRKKNKNMASKMQAMRKGPAMKKMKKSK